MFSSLDFLHAIRMPASRSWLVLSILFFRCRSVQEREYMELIQGAGSFEKNGDLDTAVRNYRQAVSLHPNRFQAYLLWGGLECRRDNTKKCSELMEDGINKAPNAERVSMKQHVYLDLAAAYHRKQMLRKAIKTLRSAIEIDPQSSVAPQLLCKLGHALHAKVDAAGGDWIGDASSKEAVEAYQTAVGLEGFGRLEVDFRASCFEMLGMMSKHLGSFEVAEKSIRSAMKLRPTHLNLRAVLVEILDWKDDQEGFLAAVEDGISLGFWERKEQTPGKYKYGVKATPWPNISRYPGVQDVVRYIESKYQQLSHEAIALTKQPSNKGLTLGSRQGLAFPGEARHGGWHEKLIECTSATSETPEACLVLQEVKRLTRSSLPKGQYLRLQPNASIRPHCGPSNDRWIVHLGLDIPQNVTITLGGETKTWIQAKCIVFDDSFRHSVAHGGDRDRLVLNVQIPNPEYNQVASSKKWRNKRKEL